LVLTLLPALRYSVSFDLLSKGGKGSADREPAVLPCGVLEIGGDAIGDKSSKNHNQLAVTMFTMVFQSNSDTQIVHK
jgi:hypothetical protein